MTEKSETDPKVSRNEIFLNPYTSPSTNDGFTAEQEKDFSPAPTVEPVVNNNVDIKHPWWHSVIEAGSATQIVIGAIIAIAIGLGVSSAVETVPFAALDILNIPGRLWLRALTAVGEFHFTRLRGGVDA
jgi:hypothetical protein